MFSRKSYLSEDKRQKILQEISDIELKFDEDIAKEFTKMLKAIAEECEDSMVDVQTGQVYQIERECLRRLCLHWKSVLT